MTAGPVLVIEDHLELREALVLLLESFQLKVLAAENGAEGLRILRIHPHVRLILLDLHMPVMDGRSFREAQRADPALASIPVIVFSGESNYAEVGAELGAVRSFPKFVSEEDLLRAVVPYL